jgi:hypothetical protein
MKREESCKSERAHGLREFKLGMDDLASCSTSDAGGSYSQPTELRNVGTEGTATRKREVSSTSDALLRLRASNWGWKIWLQVRRLSFATHGVASEGRTCVSFFRPIIARSGGLAYH